MKGYTRRKAVKGTKAIRATVTVDRVTDTAVKALCEREPMSYSAALCALATSAAIQDPGLMAAIKAVIAESVHQTMADGGYHAGLSRELARELTAGHKPTSH